MRIFVIMQYFMRKHEYLIEVIAIHFPLKYTYQDIIDYNKSKRYSLLDQTKELISPTIQ